MGLFDYMQQTERFLRDAKQELIDPQDIMIYVNRARREVAMRAQCVRRLTPISGAIIGGSVVAGGTGYSAPTVTITPPDFPSGNLPLPNGAQATGIATVIGTSISAVNMTYGGAGYFQPLITITDPTGTGASIVPQMSFINQLNPGQEVYPFSSVDLSVFPGVGAIYMVKSVSLIFANQRFSLPCYAFSEYQANLRIFPNQFQYVPAVCSQFGQGTDGSFYMYPLPSQPFQLEWDAFCIPQDLETDQSVDVIPKPWSDSVPYFAAHLAYLELQNFNYAKGYLDLFDQFVTRFGQYARPGRRINYYGIGRY